jgi:hypothetical protein
VIFALAFLVGETIGWILALALGAAAHIGDGDDVVAGVLELGLGLLLLAAAWRVRRGDVPEPRGGTGRTRALLARFEHLTPVTAAVMGTLFGLGIPKRLTITLVAAATLTAAGLSRPRRSRSSCSTLRSPGCSCGRQSRSTWWRGTTRTRCSPPGSVG